MNRDTLNMLDQLRSTGITLDDAISLRRISMTLQRWFELECGDSNDYQSWAITRGRKERRDGQHAGGHGPHYVFVHDEAGKPFVESQPHTGNDVHYRAIPDRETGARKRLAAIMARYPSLSYYVQTDPRGAALYILRPGDVPEGKQADAYYSRGIAVYK